MHNDVYFGLDPLNYQITNNSDDHSKASIRKPNKIVAIISKVLGHFILWWKAKVQKDLFAKTLLNSSYIEKKLKSAEAALKNGRPFVDEDLKTRKVLLQSALTLDIIQSSCPLFTEVNVDEKEIKGINSKVEKLETLLEAIEWIQKQERLDVSTLARLLLKKSATTPEEKEALEKFGEKCQDPTFSLKLKSLHLAFLNYRKAIQDLTVTEVWKLSSSQLIETQRKFTFQLREVQDNLDLEINTLNLSNRLLSSLLMSRYLLFWHSKRRSFL
jgi:hypothetical protein